MPVHELYPWLQCALPKVLLAVPKAVLRPTLSVPSNTQPNRRFVCREKNAPPLASTRQGVNLLSGDPLYLPIPLLNLKSEPNFTFKTFIIPKWTLLLHRVKTPRRPNNLLKQLPNTPKLQPFPLHILGKVLTILSPVCDTRPKQVSRICVLTVGEKHPLIERVTSGSATVLKDLKWSPLDSERPVLVRTLTN